MEQAALIQKLPMRFRQEVTETDFEGLEEIRLRAGWPMELYYGSQNIRLIGRVCAADVTEMLNYLTGYSLYAYEEEMKQGYFTIKGGHRVGLVGHTSMEDVQGNGGKIADMVDISGLNIRIAHEKRGISLPFIPYIRKGGGIHNTLFVAPPGVGKTTYLRDTIRILSAGEDGGPGLKVCVVDERSEIAACYMGVPQNDLGPRTDVLDNCPKQQGMQMLLRSMSPQIIAVDELGSREEVSTLCNALYSGSKVLGTIHASTIGELTEKSSMKTLVERHMIGRYILLKRDAESRRSFEIYDEKFQRLC